MHKYYNFLALILPLIFSLFAVIKNRNEKTIFLVFSVMIVANLLAFMVGFGHLLQDVILSISNFSNSIGLNLAALFRRLDQSGDSNLIEAIGIYWRVGIPAGSVVATALILVEKRRWRLVSAFSSFVLIQSAIDVSRNDSADLLASILCNFLGAPILAVVSVAALEKTASLALLRDTLGKVTELLRKSFVLLVAFLAFYFVFFLQFPLGGKVFFEKFKAASFLGAHNVKKMPRGSALSFNASVKHIHFKPQIASALKVRSEKSGELDFGQLGERKGDTIELQDNMIVSDAMIILKRYRHFYYSLAKIGASGDTKISFLASDDGLFRILPVSGDGEKGDSILAVEVIAQYGSPLRFHVESMENLILGVDNDEAPFDRPPDFWFIPWIQPDAEPTTSASVKFSYSNSGVFSSSSFDLTKRLQLLFGSKENVTADIDGVGNIRFFLDKNEMSEFFGSDILVSRMRFEGAIGSARLGLTDPIAFDADDVVEIAASSSPLIFRKNDDRSGYVVVGDIQQFKLNGETYKNTLWSGLSDGTKAVLIIVLGALLTPKMPEYWESIKVAFARNARRFRSLWHWVRSYD